MILDDLQRTLDTLLYPYKIYVFWQRKTEVKGANPDEYVVYTLDGDEAEYADDKPIIRNGNIAVRYYYRDTLLATAIGRTTIKNRIKSLVNTLQIAGFSIPYGAYDLGDIDDIGFGTTVIECYKGRVV